MDPIIVVSKINNAAKPSIPRKYCAPTDGIQGSFSTNWNSGFCASYQNHSGTEIRNPTNATTLAIHRIRFSLCLLTKSSSNAPRSGVNRMSER